MHLCDIAANSNIPVFTVMYTASQETKPPSFVIASPNIHRFSKIFHWYTKQATCNKIIPKQPTMPRNVATLPRQMLTSEKGNN